MKTLSSPESEATGEGSGPTAATDDMAAESGDERFVQKAVRRPVV